MGIIDTSSRAYGFSTYSGEWTSTTLNSSVIVRKAGPYLGYLRTGSRIHVFNSTNDRWYDKAFIGTPVGEDLEGATCIFWTSRACYGIASIWSIWFEQQLDPRDMSRGGGSAGSFGLVWTFNAAYAFRSNTGQWVRQNLDGLSIGGIASDGFGLVWTGRSAFAFNPTQGAWATINLNGVQGVSADGSGDVGLVWGQNMALAFSRTLNSWCPLETQSAIQGGSAGGQIALLWDTGHAYAFNAVTGQWDEIYTGGPSSVADPESASQSLSVFPNPCTSGHLRIELPLDSPATLRIFDVTGAEIRAWDAQNINGPFIWDTNDGNGRAIASGTYWIRAESASGRVEARKISLVR